MRAESPDVLKVAVTPATLGDCLRLRDATRGEDRHVAIGLGAVGLVSRVHPALFGSCWTFAGSSAPGQLPAATLTRQYRVRETGPTTALYGVVGSPLAHSASPAMHNAAFRELGLDAVYVPLESADADDVITFAEAVGAQGLSVTAPLKLALGQRAASADELCGKIGAANTVAWRQGRLEARNFDVEGFMAPLRRRGVLLKGRQAVVLGAGGAARAAAWALADAGARVSIAARRPAAAEALADALGLESVAWPPAGGWEVLVNATPVGTKPAVAASPMPAEALRAGRLVYDLVYNPSRTRLLDDAQAAGLETIGGLDMLVAQAASQCRWWTGQAAPTAVLAEAAEHFLSGCRD
jgi:shikimate dehydrogenase